MEENKNAVNEGTVKKETRREMRARQKAEAKALRESEKAAKAADKPEKKTFKERIHSAREWVGDHKAAVIGGATLLVGTGIGIAKAMMRSGSTETYDPDIEEEPGDEFEDLNMDENPAEETAE